MVHAKPEINYHQAIYCVIPGRRGPLWGGWPGIQCPGVAKSVCHRDRRSLPSRQLRCLCRTDFGSPYIIRDICANRLSRDPVPGVAKSVCHRDRRSLPNRQLRCLCRTDFGSPL